jgi:hypothetical protein
VVSQYADSSFLVSCYLLDANTIQAKHYLTNITSPLALTPLHLLEVRNAFKLAVGRSLIAVSEAASAWRNFQNDLRSTRLRRVAVNWPLAFRVAAIYSERYSEITGTRSLDVLHVGVAKALRSEELISFD